MTSDIDLQNQGSIDVIKAEHQAALSGQRELQAQIKEAHLAIHSYTATEEILIAMKREKEGTIKENVALEKELKCLNERHNHLQVIKELYQLAKAENQTVCQQNEALLQEVMDLCKKLENESIVQNEMDAMNASINEGSQTDILQMHIFELAQRLLRLEDLQTSYNIAMAEKELISQQNQFLQQKKGEFSRDLENKQIIKVKYETLNASNKAQRRDNDTMKKTLAEAQEKLVREADWQQKYIMAGHRRDGLEREHRKLSENIQLFQGKLTSQGELKKSYTTMEAVRKTLTSENITLRKRLNGLQKKCTAEEHLQEKVTAVQASNRGLERQVQEHQDQIKTVTDMLGLYDSLQERNKGLNRENVTLLDDLLELMKTVQEKRARQAKR
ncbi:girdin-like [Pseudochaenichthys georgianus]|uniref:girdin-like n=1 Tax=Pseudochaenichthys georgianus TaxID=52239 RepID=UPI001469AB70|nr:mitotic spindle assembly checkpoint protein MAD1-like [Pseudochaenichthys georgianus]